VAVRKGARPEAWDIWIDLGAGSDLLPAVADTSAEISPDSKLQEIGKTPSRYNAQGQVVGIAKWTQYQPSDQEIERWKSHGGYNLSVQTRGEIKAIDGDVADPVKARAIRDAITSMLGPCPVRYRDNSGKFLIPFRLNEAIPKRVLPVDGGMVEVLGVGQQFIADGMHPSGSRYQWNGTALPEMPVLDMERFEALCTMLAMCFGTDEWKIAKEKRNVERQDVPRGEDDVANWLADNWTVHDVGPEGQLFIECPYGSEHTTDSGPTSTAYFPAGTGGYEQGHFVCLHAHCTGRSDRDYLDATGYSVSDFEGLFQAPAVGAGDDESKSGGEDAGEGAQVVRFPALVRDKQGRIEPTADNLVKLLVRPDLVGKHLAFDEFKDELIWAPADQRFEEAQWRSFGDVDYVDLRIALERRGMKPMGHELLRSTVARAAFDLRFDTAQEWLSRLTWDGVDRVETFCVRGWGWEDSAYSRAVGRYIWTALAGRVIEPGCQCDMAPILVGPQGAGKTSAIKAMAPSEEHYVTIPLDDHDDDTSRRLRGKLVGELEELRGLNSRAIEVIKAWITRTTEGWIPKYREFENTFKRRLIFFGSTNDDEFLNDPTGERRWLPGRCGKLDIDWIKANREQMWAEGAARFMLEGVAWREAAELSSAEHHQFKVTDSWESAVERWLDEKQLNGRSPAEEGQVKISDALSGAVNVPLQHQDRGKEMRMVKVLRHLGWERKRVPGPDGKRVWAYVKEEQ
jgi:predicted P-loop ATPase